MKIIEVDVSSITVEDRTRIKPGAIGELAQSIRQLGLLQPLVVDDNLRLHCGGRRLEAVKLLGWEKVSVILISTLSEVERLEVELDENSRRKQLTWLEELRLRNRITFKWQEEGKSLQWIADRLSLFYNNLITALSLFQTIQKNPFL